MSIIIRDGDEERRRRPSHWFQLVLCVSFSALMLIAGRQAGHPVCKHPVPLILSDCWQHSVVVGGVALWLSEFVT